MSGIITNAIYRQKPCTLYVNKRLIKRYDSITKAAELMGVTPVKAAKAASKQKLVVVGKAFSLYFSLSGNYDPKPEKQETYVY